MITYNAITSTREKGQQLVRALELLTDIHVRGLEPNVIAYNVTISACGKGQQPERAFALLAECLRTG